MTTVEAEHAFAVYCEGKSCREIFHLECRSLDIRTNEWFMNSLSPAPNDFEAEEILCSPQNFLGRQGVRAAIPVVRINKMLIHLAFPSQGVDDETVEEIIEAVRSHERIGQIDLRDNKDITPDSANGLLKLLDENKMLTSILLEGTCIGKAVEREVKRRGERNAMLEADFFKGEFSRLKRLFCELDTTGEGHISVGALLAQIEIPQVANALEKRFQSLDDGPSLDGFLDVNEFMRFTYSGYQQLPQLIQHAQREDSDDANIRANWDTFYNSFKKGRIYYAGYHHIRLAHRVLEKEEIQKIVDRAVENEWFLSGDNESTADGRLKLRVPCFTDALEKAVGAELKEFLASRAGIWGPIRITPTMTRMMMEAFIQSVDGEHQALMEEGTDKPTEAELGKLYDFEVKTENLVLKTAVIQQRLTANGIGSSITVTFPEWFAVVNELYDLCMYPVFNPMNWFEKIGSDDDNDEEAAPTEGSTNEQQADAVNNQERQEQAEAVSVAAA